MLGTVVIRNVGSQASVYVQDLSSIPVQSQPYFFHGQARYFAPGQNVTIFRDAAVEVSLASGQLKKLIDKGIVTAT